MGVSPNGPRAPIPEHLALHIRNSAKQNPMRQHTTKSRDDSQKENEALVKMATTPPPAKPHLAVVQVHLRNQQTNAVLRPRRKDDHKKKMGD
jgi:hypothetical protein